MEALRTRRDMLLNFSAGLVLAGSAPVRAQTALAPWPGLASRMSPRPDHGQKSYRGSGRLAGGDSGIGRDAGRVGRTRRALR
jgi:hypothetical protein